MESSTKGYSPEQVATGMLDNGRTVVILYIKEFREQLQQVSKAGQIQYYYTWSYKEESESYILFIYWMNDQEITILFPPKQHSVVESLRTPNDLIITSVPINELVEGAQRTGQEFLDIEDAVLIPDVIFKESQGINN